MKLYDIRIALKNLVRINKDLTKDRLTTLLEAAGWDEQDIKDAILMWETNAYVDAETTSTGVEIVEKEDITPSTNIAESATEIFAETALVKEVIVPKEEKHIEEHIETPVKEVSAEESKSVIVPLPIQDNVLVEKQVKVEEKELPPSTFEHVSKMSSHDELPHNLPLRPYESSFTTVALNEYEKRFASHVNHHVETMQSHPNAPSVVPESIVVPKPIAPVREIPVFQPVMPIIVDKVVEAPLETEDKYLVFIAIILFIFIMFILGYMHIAGRI